ncbi:MAG: class I SAM-dependent methyltransferase [Candidatus Buchananbacteria bacterium]
MNYQDSPINFKKGKLVSGVIYPEFFPLNHTQTVLNIGCGDGVQALVYQGNFKKMLGVDVNAKSLDTARQLINYYHLDNFEVMSANVEDLPLHEDFDRILAIDIIEHVIHPDLMLKEAYRLLKPDGLAMITFPAMHDKWERLFRFVGRQILRRRPKSSPKEGWDPDQHQYNYSLAQWQALVSAAGFKMITCRATTMFPPLHYLGLPKFWFSNNLIRKIDGLISRIPIIKNFGQSLVCIYKK